MDEKSILKYFGVPYDVVTRVVQIKDKGAFFWAIEDDENEETVTVQCAASREDIYDYDDSTLADKIVTDKALLFRNPAHENTLLAEKYINKYNGDIIYVMNVFDDKKCLFQTE
ncbi:MAG: hypothetical protein PHP06_02805 [Clostridia bacterium]|nr:hypothetical protein [Clostridia bacterium]